ncbi:MAG TPA: hypothetical protein VMM16_12120 [Verrucomicrobiae bacterium]|nr:hypothetical protein [Verrucomicrobiae bacterium]
MGKLSEGRGIRWVVGLWVLFIASFVVLSVCLGTRTDIVYAAVTLVLFMVPGFAILPMFGTGRGVRLERAVVGAVFGLAISSYATIVAAFRFGWSPKAIVLTIVALSAVCAAVGRILRGGIELPVRKWRRIDYGILGAMSTVVVLFTAAPALHVGKLTERGYAYTWLYGLDFVSRADFAVAMTTKLPPDFFWMTGIPLRMYLVGYAMPAFAFAASGKTVAMHSVMLLITLCLSLLMVACLYIFLRTLFSDTKVLVGSMCLALMAYSYYWMYDAVKTVLMKPGQRMQFYDSVSHLFQRSFLVEPQTLLATSLLLIVLSMLALVKCRLESCALAIFMGVCLGVCFGIDAMQGLVVIGWFGLFHLGRLVLDRRAIRKELAPFLASIVSVGLICGSFFLLGMYRRSSSHLVVFNFNTWIIKYGLVFFPVEFGPLLFLGGWGLIRWWRSREDFGWPMLALGAFSMLPVLFLKQTTVPRERMADRLLPIVLIIFAAYLIRELWALRDNRTARLVTVGIALAAAPTFFADIYYTSNVNDLYNTRYVRVEDKQACDWIRRNLPETAVIQGRYNYYVDPDRGLYLSLISSFAQRPQVLGWFSGAATLVDDGWRLAEQRREEIEAVLGSRDLSVLEAFLRKYSVGYVYVGPLEQAKSRTLLPLLQSAPGEFRQVYVKGGVAIFRYLGREDGHSSQALLDNHSQLNPTQR